MIQPETYSKAGIAHFYCPRLSAILDDAHHTDSDWTRELSQRNGQGHRSFTFMWQKGDLNLMHPANGGVPKCSCGLDLVLVRGDNPLQ